jgi:hypothetical protein
LKNSTLTQELRKLGYDRDDTFSSSTHHGESIEADYSKKTLNHSVFINCKMNHANFDYAALTGSSYENCTFLDCSMYQTDFEFCTFKKCQFLSKKKVIASFNGCDFIEVRLENIVFESCTFTGATFQNCYFENTKIVDSTLENALYIDCVFLHMNLRNLNMDFIQIEQPQMNDVVLPFAQIPYMFGCLEYLLKTKDDVTVSSHNSDAISIVDYFNIAIPKLILYWSSSCKDRSEFYFPLSNVYLAQGEYRAAMNCLRNGLQASIVVKDYRMLKFYCKLIARSSLFQPSATQKFYDLINRFAPKEKINSPEMRNFMRNIGEIKETLFSLNAKPKLTIQFRTDMSLEESDKVGSILGKIFSFAKMPRDLLPNHVELRLTENSPLLISASISGSEKKIVALLPLMLYIAGMPTGDIVRLCPAGSYLVQENISSSIADPILLNANHLIDECRSRGVSLTVTEYYLENCIDITEADVAVTYYSSSQYSLMKDNASLFLE